MAASPRELLAYRENIYSQNGEDGVLREIFRRLGRKPEWVVEFGAWDGLHLSNTWVLLEQGANGVLIEADPDKFAQLVQNVSGLPGDVTPLHELVTAGAQSNVMELMGSTPIPEDFDLLSLDTDGPDVPIWRALDRFSPSVVVIETNGQPPGVVELSKDGSTVSAACLVGREKGYRLVCHTGNCIFVRDDLVDQLGLDAAVLGDEYVLFDPYYRSKNLVSGARFMFTKDGWWHVRNDLRLAQNLVADQGLAGFYQLLYHKVYQRVVPARARARLSACLTAQRGR
jgi:hypothetical protein